MPDIQCISAKNPEWADETKRAIRMDVVFSHIPNQELSFVACEFDCEEHGRDLYRRALNEDFGPIQPYQPPSIQEVSEEVKYERNMRLIQTDWTQNADVPESTRLKWIPYRQALRDIPQQPGFPYHVDWPTPPM